MKHSDPVAFLPLRFLDAFDGGQVSIRQLALAAYLVGKSYERRNRGTGWTTIRTSDLTERFDVSADTIGRDLHALEAAGWIACDVSAGQRGGWQIGLTGLASPAQPPQDLRRTSANQPPDLRRSTSAPTSAEVESDNGASPDAEPGSAASEPPQEPPQDDVAPGDTTPHQDHTTPHLTPGIEKNKRKDLGPLRAGEHEISRLDARAELERLKRTLWPEGGGEQ